MPTLARTSSVRPWKRNGSSIERASAVAIASACSTVVPGRQQDGELVAADAGHELGAGHGGLEPRPDLAQEPVAGLVAERVVELLEVVEVDQQQRELGLGGAGLGRRLLEAREQAAAVGQPGQRVVHRVVLALGGERAQLGLELAAIGRVAHVEHVAGDAGVVQAVGGDDVEVAVAALAVDAAAASGCGRGRGGRRPRRSSRRAPSGRRGGRRLWTCVPTIASGSWASTPRIEAACQRTRRSSPTIVTTSVEFWTIEVSRRWMISEARSATNSDWPRTGASAVPMARDDVAVDLRLAHAGVRAEERAHPQPVAGERADRSAVEAAEAEADDRQQRVARGDVQDHEGGADLDQLQREREAVAPVAVDPVGGEPEREDARPRRAQRGRGAGAGHDGGGDRADQRQHEEEQPEARERRRRQLERARTKHLAQ